MSIAVLALLAMSQAAAGKPPARDAQTPPPIVSAPSPPPPVIVPSTGTPAPSSGRARINATRGAVPSASNIAAGATPRMALQSLISMADYPASALAGREQGRSSFRLAVGPDGRVAGCVVLVSTGSSALDATTCRIMRSRARFTPARDSTGTPIEDQYFGEVTWRIER